MNNRIFTKEVCVKGSLWCSYVFESQEDVDRWLLDYYPKLIKEYTDINYTVRDLPGLKIGDKCKVYGEGSDIFTITALKKYEDNRYGFILNGGDREEVGKCYI